MRTELYYYNRIERKKDRKVKRFRTDNGLEFCNRELMTYFKSVGIKYERSNVEMPQMNGVAERINRTLLDLTRSMLKSACLSQNFWAEAVTIAAYIKNRVIVIRQLMIKSHLQYGLRKYRAYAI